MAIYVVGYDLHEGQDYSNLIEALKGFPNWWHHLDSTWLIETDWTAEQIRDHLWQHMYDDDELLVMYYLNSGAGGSAAWKGFNERGSKWLKAHL